MQARAGADRGIRARGVDGEFAAKRRRLPSQRSRARVFLAKGADECRMMEGVGVGSTMRAGG